MIRWVSLISILTATATCAAQQTTLVDARRDLAAARKPLDKLVVFCEWCDGTGRLAGHACPHCDGLGTMLQAEYKAIQHRHELEDMARRKGLPTSQYARFDIAHRQKKYRQQLEPQALKLLPAYVEYLKVCREYDQLVQSNEQLKKKTAKTVAGLDHLVDRYGRRLRLKSLQMLYAKDPAGKVGTFVFYGKPERVRLDGDPVEVYHLRTLKEHVVLLDRKDARPRKGFVLAEIVGKDTYKTDDGKELSGILLHAY